MTKRALLVAFHFPPHSESSGIHRTLSLTKNLEDFGWEPIVLSAVPGAYEQKNSSQLSAIRSHLIVKRTFAVDSKRHLGIFGRYPEWVAIPDRWISWWFSAVPAGLSLIRRHKLKVIWSTFPISTAHLIALSLHRLTGLPWVADFRDPMLQINHPKSRWQRKVFKWIEYQAIRRCTKAVFTTRSALNSYKERFPSTLHEKFIVIENGYSEDDFAGFGIDEIPQVANAKRCVTLLHSGVLYTEGRDPSAFFRAISVLKKAKQVNAGNLSVILRASEHISYFADLAKKYGVEDIVKLEPPISYREALQEMLAVDGLLIFQGTTFNTQIPSKVYEYFRARKPILGLLDPTGETARVLAASGFQHLVPMNSVESIVPALENFISQIRNGEAYVANDDVIAASSRRRRTKQLAEIFDQLVYRSTEISSATPNK